MDVRLLPDVHVAVCITHLPYTALRRLAEPQCTRIATTTRASLPAQHCVTGAVDGGSGLEHVGVVDVGGDLVTVTLRECSAYLSAGARNAAIQASEGFLVLFDAADAPSFAAARDMLQVIASFKETAAHVVHLVGVTRVDGSDARAVSMAEANAVAEQLNLAYAEISWNCADDFVSVRGNVVQLVRWMHAGALLRDSHEQLRQTLLAALESQQREAAPTYSIPIDITSTRIKGAALCDRAPCDVRSGVAAEAGRRAEQHFLAQELEAAVVCAAVADADVP